MSIMNWWVFLSISSVVIPGRTRLCEKSNVFLPGEKSSLMSMIGKKRTEDANFTKNIDFLLALNLDGPRSGIDFLLRNPRSCVVRLSDMFWHRQPRGNLARPQGTLFFAFIVKS